MPLSSPDAPISPRTARTLAPLPGLELGRRHVLELVARGAELTEILTQLVLTIEEQTEGMIGSVLLLDPREKRLRHGAAPRLPQEYNAAIDGLKIGAEVGSCGTAAFTNEVVIVSDVTTDPRWAPFVELVLPFGLRACWSHPIRSTRGDVLGTFALYYDKVREPSATELKLIEDAAHIAAIALENKLAESAVREGEARLRQIIDLVPHMIFAKDSDGRFLLANQAVADAYGTTVEELVGALHDDIHATKEELEHFRRDDLEVIRSGQPKFIPEETFVDSRGEERVLQTTKIPLNSPDGAENAVLGVAVDITELDRVKRELARHRDDLEKAIEERTADLAKTHEQLRRSERLASIGTLAAGIAHELNNPLGLLVLELERTRRFLDRPEKLLGSLEEIEENVNRCTEIVRNVMRFAREERSAKSACDVNDTAKRARDLTSAYCSRHGGTLVLDLDSDLPAVEANQTELEQVFVNLIHNALHASPPDGRVTLRTARTEGGVRVEVEDEGSGMSEEDLSRAFEPFYTTRFRSGGTGLGLSTCHGIVADHGGEIALESMKGEGTRVVLSLPGAPSVV